MSFLPVSTHNHLPVPSSAAGFSSLLAEQFEGADLSPAEQQAYQRTQKRLSGGATDQAVLAQRLSRLLPGMTSAVTYHEAHNMFTGTACTSAAGNTYFSSARVTTSVVIKADIGVGYARVFLNALYIYAADGSLQLLAHQDFHCCFYSEQTLAHQAVQLVQRVMLNSLPAPERTDAEADARLLAERIVRDAYTNDQVQMLHQKTGILPG
jgi:hypothetical protein